MLRKILKSNKAQQTAEYALLIALVVAAIIAIQTYVQRLLQARVRDAGQYLVSQTSALGGNTTQYEPYYLQSDKIIVDNAVSTEIQDQTTVSKVENSVQFKFGSESMAPAQLYNQM